MNREWTIEWFNMRDGGLRWCAGIDKAKAANAVHADRPGLLDDMLGGCLIAGLLFMAWAIFIAAMIKAVLWLLAA